MRIGRTTLAALHDVAGPSGRPLMVILTVEGGVACRLSQGTWDNPVLERLAALLIADLGYKTVEHAARREVAVEFLSANSECRVDFGGGFQAVPVAPDDA